MVDKLDPQIYTKPLTNELRVLGIETPGNVFYLEWVVLTGTSDEEVPESIHLIEHLVAPLTSTFYPSTQKNLELFASMGIKMNAHTSDRYIQTMLYGRRNAIF